MQHDNTKIYLITIIAVIAVVGLVTLFLNTMEGPEVPELSEAVLEEQQTQSLPAEQTDEGINDGS